tara:strand:+ start:117 stop:374 length:258 start_codon:yes stop_codon:yes gene_type:complete
MTKLLYLIPKKHHDKIHDVCEFNGTVEVILKEGWEYSTGSAEACYERVEFCSANGQPSETLLKRCIANEIALTTEISIDDWNSRH